MNRKPETISFWSGRLPHWEVEDGRYFVTLHIAGAIPVEGRERLRSQSAALQMVSDPKSDAALQLQRAIFAEMECWLDQCQWNPFLATPEIANLVVESLQHREKIGDWRLFEYVVMPTHLHLFCEVLRGSLREIMEEFKRWTSRRALEVMGRTGDRFWQREWFDHWSRSDEEDEKICKYIRNNPVKAGLVAEYEQYLYGSWSNR